MGLYRVDDNRLVGVFDAFTLGAGASAPAPAPLYRERVKALRQRLARSSALARRALDAIADARLDLAERRGRRTSQIEVIARQFRETFGRGLNLSEPSGFAEKTQYLKIFDHTPMHRICADKILVRDYVAERVGADHLIPLLLVTDRPEDVRPDRIAADRFVVKATHDSGSFHVCADRRTFDWARCRRRLRRALSRDYSYIHGELQYRGLTPRIIVENFVPSAQFEDFKIFCSFGEPVLIMLNKERSVGLKENFYTPDWRQLDIMYSAPRFGVALAPPPALDRLLDVARRLSAPFRFVRVDLYVEADKVLFGEMTFHENAGLMGFQPPEFDRAFGQII